MTEVPLILVILLNSEKFTRTHMVHSYSIWQCFSTFLLQRNPAQVWRSLTEPYAMIRESSRV